MPTARRRVLLAVSGTLQDGFELRRNLDHPETPAILVGDAVVRGVRAHLDIKEPGAREYAAPPAAGRVNPANVVTGRREDANLYAVYLIDERVLAACLLGEPRHLAIAPDAVRIDLTAPETSPAVVALVRAAAAEGADEAGTPTPLREACIPTVVACFHAPTFVEMAPRAGAAGAAGAGGTPNLTSFPEGLAQLAGVPLERVRDASAVDAGLRAAEARLDARAAAAARAVLSAGDGGGGGGAASAPRIGGRWDDAELASLAIAAGFGGERDAYGPQLGALVRGALGCADDDGVDGEGGGEMLLDAQGEQMIARRAGAELGSEDARRVPAAEVPSHPPHTSKVPARVFDAACRLLRSPTVLAANRAAAAKLARVWPVLARVRPAWEAIHGAASAAERPRLILHAGPPVPDGFVGMCGPMRGAIIGAILLEGWAADAAAAEALARSGGVALAPCHEHRAVGPMAGVISPSMPVLVVVDARHADAAHAAAAADAPASAPPGSVAFCNLNEGLGKCLRFGAHAEAVLERLRWMRDGLGPALDAALLHMRAEACASAHDGAHAAERLGLAIRPPLGHALAMGDEGHNRCKAVTSLLVQAFAPPLTLLTAARDGAPPALSAETASRCIRFISGNAHFGLNVVMAASKVALDAVVGIEHCTLTTALSRNGVRFGVRVAGATAAAEGSRPKRAKAAPASVWFTAPSPLVPSAVWFKGYSAQDANRDMGDSSITETLGFGAPAMAAAPALLAFVGGTAADADRYTAEAGRVYCSRGTWPEMLIPALDFAGVPMLLDAARVVALAQRPAINTGIAHREAGVGQIGAGMSRAPLEAFNEAVLHLDKRLAESGEP